MRPGAVIRRALGPAEHWTTAMYRRCFIDLRRFAEDLAQNLCVTTILDVGCGEGQSTEALADAFRGASMVGVDITPASDGCLGHGGIARAGRFEPIPICLFGAWTYLAT